MTNSRASRGLTLLYSNTLTGTSNSVTYTPPIPLTELMFKKLEIEIHGSNTATLILQCKISEVTSYNVGTILNDAGTVTSAYAAAATQIDLIPISLLDEARFFSFIGKIVFAGSTIHLSGIGHAGGEGNCIVSSENSASTITEIEIKVSTSTLASGTTINIWGQR